MNIRKAVRAANRFLRRYRRLIWLVLIVFGTVAALFYLNTFFTKGVSFNGIFLEKEMKKSTIVYSGKDDYGDVSLSVNRKDSLSMDIAYTVPYNKLKSYKIVLGEEKNFWQTISITGQNGSVLFDGKYQKHNSFLYDKNSVPSHGYIPQKATGESFYLTFEPNLREMVGIATGEYEELRGDVGKLLIALLLAALVLIDVKNPMISYRIRQFIMGEEPQPTEWFELIQGILRAIVLITSAAFLFSAV